MSLQLLDGTDASVGVVATVPGGGTAQLRCTINALEYRRVRGFQNAETLCSGKWASELPGKNQDFLRILKFASKGDTASDLSPFLTATAAASITLTVQTGCTFSGTYWLDTDSIGVNAGQVAMPGEANFRSKDAIATAWVTS